MTKYGYSDLNVCHFKKKKGKKTIDSIFIFQRQITFIGSEP